MQRPSKFRRMRWKPRLSTAGKGKASCASTACMATPMRPKPMRAELFVGEAIPALLNIGKRVPDRLSAAGYDGQVAVATLRLRGEGGDRRRRAGAARQGLP